MKPLEDALLTLEHFGDTPSEIDPAEVSVAYNRLHESVSDNASQKLVDKIGTCCEQLVVLKPSDDWRSNYLIEVWGEELLELCDELRLKLRREEKGAKGERGADIRR